MNVDKPKVIADCTKAIIDEVDAMSREFYNLRKSGALGRVFDNDEWIEFEVAESLSGTNYTMVPKNFYERLTLAVLRVVAPCPQCRGTGIGPIAPDFLGDKSEKMTVGTCSFCELCRGTGVDPSFGQKKSRDMLDKQ